MENSTPSGLIDTFGRSVDYVRLSVTDRCDFRCVYCMAEDMTFAPKSEVLNLEELHSIAKAMTDMGVRKIRLTGGEPLIRPNIMSLIERLGALEGLDELALTTNGSQLQRLAPALKSAGVKRINISLDSLSPRKFRHLTRHGNLDQVIAGIDAAVATGFDGIKLNAVILKGRNEDEVLDLVAFARERDIDIAFIEEMPLGRIVEHDREITLCSSDEIRQQIEAHYALTSLGDPTGTAGPARYYQLGDRPSRVGFISPHSNNFCHLCNRVRVTVEGRLLLCLGNEHSVDLREVLRADHYKADHLKRAIVDAMALKPEKHHFDNAGEPQILRFMNVTGG
ncbi:cyclic pyranopterin phosphate synthase [Halioglobus sp. HI00S01]|uniref:GTP 3',8-cyclase MoaA n=1 Tax=Halioglobus sp. HI00S01 TaxID=1822214 RepID=UPI0007C27B1A|nr:GTP 3',8-cyclase MoaA [Halioglobus sp. HI00S01]KZX56842.1 cyclic pyranopterin phosphate synthase [Halioglobus sp. HI00S01]